MNLSKPLFMAALRANPPRQYIGLGKATRVERLEVHWPTTGKTQVFKNVALDRMREITEGGDALREMALNRFKLASDG